MTPWILVTPASRGLGLALTRHLFLTTQLPIVATTRGGIDQTKEAILHNIDGQRGTQHGDVIREERLHVLKLDFTDETSVADAASACQDLFLAASKTADPSHLHLAVVLPGTLTPEKSPSQLDLDSITKTFQINTISHLLMLKHFSKFLPRKSTKGLPPPGEQAPEWCQNLAQTHATWATMSARVGSISDNSLGGWYSYRASKAGVNQLTKTFDNYLKTTAADKAIAVSLHPGTVRTDLSREFWGNVQKGKLFEPEYSAEKLCGVLRDLAVDGRGKCWDWAGKEIPP